MDIETKRRLEIIKQITEYLEQHAGPIVSSRVVGSMSFAQNHAIRPDSDIDLDVFVPFDQLVAINPFLEFLHGNMRFEDNESWQAFDLIAVDCSYQGIVVNLWAINIATYADIASFKQERLRFYSITQPSETKTYKLFTGGICTLDRHVQAFHDGYKSDRPTLYNGQLISENYVLNNMFFMFPIFGAEYSNRVVDEMWVGFLQKYPLVTAEQLYGFIIDKVSSRFSPDFKRKLDDELKSRLAQA